jgi:hypothetical protein
VRGGPEGSASGNAFLAQKSVGSNVVGLPLAAKTRNKHRSYAVHKAKNGKRYRVTLFDNAIEWLRPYVQESDSLLAISRATNTRGKPSKDRTHRLISEAAAKAGGGYS